MFQCSYTTVVWQTQQEGSNEDAKYGRQWREVESTLMELTMVKQFFMNLTDFPG
jgi:hypothetical protein